MKALLAACVLSRTFNYPAHVTRVVDGDTVAADVWLTPTIHEEMRLRLLDIDTPELDSHDQDERKRAVAAAAYTGSRVLGQQLVVHTEAFDHFGRHLAYLWIGDECLNDTLLVQGYAKRWGKAP